MLSSMVTGLSPLRITPVIDAISYMIDFHALLVKPVKILNLNFSEKRGQNGNLREYSGEKLEFFYIPNDETDGTVGIVLRNLAI